MSEIRKFIKDQLSVWPLAAANFRALKKVRTKDLRVFGLDCRVQCNPERVQSSTADTSPEAIAARKCFLCEGNRPAEQFHIPFEGRKGRMYRVQLNPYPIFPGHLVIARAEHRPQMIWHHFPDMLDFASAHPDYTVFYNGPHSGASAPDHLHFQAVPRRSLPLEEAVDAFLDSPAGPLATVRDASLYRFDGFCRGVYALKASTGKSLAKLFYRLLDCVSRGSGEDEPMFNLYIYAREGEYRTFVVMRSKIRPHHYYSDGEDRLTISPGAADMAGFFVAPYPGDFDRVTEAVLEQMLDEVCITEHEQKMIDWRLGRSQDCVEVGIMAAREIGFEIISDGAGPQRVRWCDGRIAYNGMLYDELTFDAVTLSTLFAGPSFILHDVCIGIDFHWQRERTLKFAGSLRFVVEGDRIRAINRIGLEDYLLSVISSEMSSGAGLELLKAHAVISRSWVLQRIRDRRSGAAGIPHREFDVCADDHCQRYQGIGMAAGETVRRAIDETWGQTLVYKGEICDTRYSKCCGGRTELFSTCWEDTDPGYLASVEDPYCDCGDPRILSQVLNDYDLETGDFYSWSVHYTREELSDIVRGRSGRDFGEIVSLEALERGPSGRIKYLRITGTKHSEVIGKELNIRRILSRSHLKSSAFEISETEDGFRLDGRGWGHGVGLCQIGAAVMAEKGFGYGEILRHYYNGAEIVA